MNEELKTGWLALKEILKGNSDYITRTNMVEVTVGARYLELCAHGAVEPENTGGDQYYDDTIDPETAWLPDYEVGTKNYGHGYMPDDLNEKLEAAKLEADELLEMLNLVGYTVSYLHHDHWRERKPRIGDLVTIPQDLWADMNSEEPLEDRPSNRNGGNHVTDDRWSDNHKRAQLHGRFHDTHRSIRLYYSDILKSHPLRIAAVADREELSYHGAALRILRNESIRKVELRIEGKPIMAKVRVPIRRADASPELDEQGNIKTHLVDRPKMVDKEVLFWRDSWMNTFGDDPWGKFLEAIKNWTTKFPHERTKWDNKLYSWAIHSLYTPLTILESEIIDGGGFISPYLPISDIR